MRPASITATWLQNIAHHRHFMGDKQDGQPEVAVDVLQKLRTCRVVSGSSAEVASSDNSTRQRRQRPGDADAGCFWPPDGSAG